MNLRGMTWRCVSISLTGSLNMVLGNILSEYSRSKRYRLAVFLCRRWVAEDAAQKLVHCFYRARPQGFSFYFGTSPLILGHIGLARHADVPLCLVWAQQSRPFASLSITSINPRIQKQIISMADYRTLSYVQRSCHT